MLLALLLLPGLLIRAAVPAGFMPATGQGAALTMAMCSGQATQSVVVHPDGARYLPTRVSVPRNITRRRAFLRRLRAAHRHRWPRRLSRRRRCLPIMLLLYSLRPSPGQQFEHTLRAHLPRSSDRPRLRIAPARDLSRQQARLRRPVRISVEKYLSLGGREMSAVATGVRLALRSIMPVGAATLAQCLVFATVLAASASDVSSTRELEQVVVTAPRMTAPLLVVTDPKQPRQPLPAHDGADYLKTIPGFSVIRKGGTDGDPVLRGMAGSRLGILLDGEQRSSAAAAGAWIRRPPTSSPKPTTASPCSRGRRPCCTGPGNSAGSCLFERERRALRRAGPRPTPALTWRQLRPQRRGRRRARRHARGLRPAAPARARDSDDYEDGNGHAVHSRLQALERQRRARLDAGRARRGSSSPGARATARPPTPTARWTASKFTRDNVGLRFERAASRRSCRASRPRRSTTTSTT